MHPRESSLGSEGFIENDFLLIAHQAVELGSFSYVALVLDSRLKWATGTTDDG